MQPVPSLRGHLASCCCRLVPCHRSGGPLIPGDSAQQQCLPPPGAAKEEGAEAGLSLQRSLSESLWQGHTQSPISWGMTTAAAHPNPTVAEVLVSVLSWVI